MLKKYLPQDIYYAINSSLNFFDINEIRLRVGCPVLISIKNKKFYLGERGICNESDAFIFNFEMMQDFIFKICDKSVYAVNDNLKMGFITLPYGIRVGICGEVVTENEKIITIKNFSSANIRIPHFVKNCSLFAFDYIIDNGFKNTLVLSKPGAGKTTFIRDVVYQLSKHNYSYNVLIADERGEIASVNDGCAQINLGNFADIYSYSTKEFAFKQGIRSMRPDIFVTDEIDLDKDINCIYDAINSGINVLATMHCDDIIHLKNKRKFEEVISSKLFDRYIFLSDSEGPGTLTYIYDAKFQCLFCR